MKCLVILAAGLAATAAVAETPPAPAKASARNGDANEIVCRTVRVIGSRLSTRRYCMTRAEWLNRRAQARQSLDLMADPEAGSGGIF